MSLAVGCGSDTGSSDGPSGTNGDAAELGGDVVPEDGATGGDVSADMGPADATDTESPEDASGSDARPKDTESRDSDAADGRDHIEAADTDDAGDADAEDVDAYPNDPDKTMPGRAGVATRTATGTG